MGGGRRVGGRSLGAMGGTDGDEDEDGDVFERANALQILFAPKMLCWQRAGGG